MENISDFLTISSVTKLILILIYFCQNDTNYIIHAYIYMIDRKFFLSRSLAFILILSKYSYDHLLHTYEFKKKIIGEDDNVVFFMWSHFISILFWWRNIWKLRNELKSNFRSLNISWDQSLNFKSRTCSYHEVLIRSKLVSTVYFWEIYDCLR